jgi:prepilin-type N-terminal cleavage/methylation domain-containing protein
MIRKLRQKTARNEKGFTLIELMIVIAIIGILAAIAIPQFSAYRERSYIASMKADCNTVRTAEEAYFVDNDTYTVTNADLPGLPAAFSAGNTVTVTAGAGGIGVDFIVTVTSTKTNSTVTYTSSTGATVTT